MNDNKFNLQALFSIAIAFSLLYSLIYNHSYWIYFGIDIFQYLTISELVSYSLSSLLDVVHVVPMILIFLFLLHHLVERIFVKSIFGTLNAKAKNVSNADNTQKLASSGSIKISKIRKFVDSTFLGALWFFIGILLIVLIVQLPRDISIPTLAYCVLLASITYFFAKNRDRISDLLFKSAKVNFTLILASTSLLAFSYVDGRLNAYQKYNLQTIIELNNETINATNIGRTSNFWFLWNYKTCKVEILKVDQVNSLKLSSHKSGHETIWEAFERLQFKDFLVLKKSTKNCTKLSYVVTK